MDRNQPMASTKREEMKGKNVATLSSSKSYNSAAAKDQGKKDVALKMVKLHND